jgi:uncharacterized RDD family membrane protein YckC
MLYDVLLVLAIWLFTLFPFVAAANDAVAGAAMQSLLFVEMFSFFAYFWVARGQTLGMLAWRLHVVTVDGHPITLKQALLRFIGGLLAVITLGLGFAWQLFDAHRRSWPDLISGTRIIYQPK